jgi:excisionase family DNA binding protein
MMNDRLLNVEQAAAMLGRTPHAMYRLIARRKVPYRKDGRRVLFLERELLAFVEALPGLSLEEMRDQQQLRGRGGALHDMEI